MSFPLIIAQDFAMNMTLELYKSEVVKRVSEDRANVGLNKVCCVDTVARSFHDGKSIEEAVYVAALDTSYWEGDV
jgi:hypothetical protein